MRIAVMSDLHLEFDAAALAGRGGRGDGGAFDFFLRPPQSDADVIVLAGDIHAGAQGVGWAADSFAVPVVMVAGNHEPYGREVFQVIADCRQQAAATGQVSFLERATWTFTSAAGERARFVGTTLWTDFRLYGPPQAAMDAARDRLEDYQIIDVGQGPAARRLAPADTLREFEASLRFLRAELEKPFDGITVVVTHHAPSLRSVAPEFDGHPLTPAFVSDLEDLIESCRPDLWIHGHVHNSFDYRVGRTRVLCNPRGYFPDQLNPAFDPVLVVDVGRA